MAANARNLQPVTSRGALMGLSNLFAKESGGWWRTRKWLIHTLVYMLVINGVLTLVLFFDPAGMEAAQQPEAAMSQAMMLFLSIVGAASTLGAVVVMQDAVIDEKRSGTAAWVLSKPVSRAAFLTSKVLANGMGCVLTAILVPAVLAYGQMALAGLGQPALVPFAAGLGITALHQLYYLLLTLMLGTFFNGRGFVVGVPLALMAGVQQLITMLFPWTATFLPGGLVNASAGAPPLSATAALGLPIADYTNLAVVAFSCLVFFAIALWRFNREEF